jgi:hypothetical protein
MKEKVARIKERELYKFSFEYGNEDLKKQIFALNEEKDSKKISELKSQFKYYEYHIQEPTFEQLTAANDVLYTNDGKLNLMSAGKVVWELCCVSFDPIIEKKPKILMTICNQLSEFVLPLDLEIKKKISQYRLSGNTVGLGQKIALILFYLGVDIYKSNDKINDLAKYWSQILYLQEKQILPLAQVPLKFKQCRTNK